MSSLPYREAFERIHAEFSEMPGMRLTPEQVERLSGVDRAVCQCVLDDLVRARFLSRLPNGSYGRLSEMAKPESRPEREWKLAPGPQTRRAS